MKKKNKNKLKQYLLPILISVIFMGVYVLATTTISDQTSSFSGLINGTNISINSTTATSANLVYVEDNGNGTAIKAFSRGTGADSNAGVFTSYSGSTSVHIQKLSTATGLNQSVLKILKNPSSGVHDIGALLVLLNNYTGPETDQPSLSIENEKYSTPFFVTYDKDGISRTKLLYSGGIYINVTDAIGIQLINNDSSSNSYGINLNLFKNGMTVTNVASGGVGLLMSSASSGTNALGLLQVSQTHATATHSVATFSQSGAGVNLQLAVTGNATALNITSSSYLNPAIRISDLNSNVAINITGSTDVIQSSNLTGAGTALLCVDSVGKLYRGNATACP